MANTSQFAYIQNRAGTVTVPVTELKTRVIQYYRADYTSGVWNPDNTYNWIPGTFYDFTPRKSDSVIFYSMRLPTSRHTSGATHCIGNFYFYANNIIYYQWEESLQHMDNGKTWQFQVPSWGTSTGRIGMQNRAHANDNNEIRMYTTEYWDGAGSNQNCRGQLIIEEISL
jgi:hypothetical protein